MAYDVVIVPFSQTLYVRNDSVTVYRITKPKNVLNTIRAVAINFYTVFQIYEISNYQNSTCHHNRDSTRA